MGNGNEQCEDKLNEAELAKKIFGDYLGSLLARGDFNFSSILKVYGSESLVNISEEAEAGATMLYVIPLNSTLPFRSQKILNVLIRGFALKEYGGIFETPEDLQVAGELFARGYVAGVLSVVGVLNEVLASRIYTSIDKLTDFLRIKGGKRVGG